MQINGASVSIPISQGPRTIREGAERLQELWAVDDCGETAFQTQQSSRLHGLTVVGTACASPTLAQERQTP